MLVGSFKDKEFHPQRADLDPWGGIGITNISERDVLKFVRAMVHTAEAAGMMVKVSSIERDWASGERPRISPVAAREHDPKGTPRRQGRHCVMPTPDSTFGDLIDLDVNATIRLVKDRLEWKKNRPSKRC